MQMHQILKDKGGDIVTVAPGSKVSEAARLLSEKRIGAVIVADGDKPAGILSERDIVRELGRRGTSCLDDPVDALMTRDPVACTPQDRTDAVLERMTEGRFRHMPVIEDGRMVGLISIGDVVKARLAQLAMERDALEGMVMGH
ncbi:CBS domain protein [Oceaniovalibus guishaninsula JLT2003]|uniref:CBS domain protein n=1 Tax=Oceaniovalibus guishaninsula JLT2003 TaxID=1231392 RepID=K2GTC2_9RHOB|nr:CBS domain-containing protein [Oceaniovalibus guishaninsula]EKE45806.1 CBS domain protein [Oceaniovalibus guishaninsula JLT2003]